MEQQTFINLIDIDLLRAFFDEWMNGEYFNVSLTGTVITVTDKQGHTNSIDLAAEFPSYRNFIGSGPNAAAGLVPSPGTTQGDTKFLCENGRWVTPPASGGSVQIVNNLVDGGTSKALSAEMGKTLKGLIDEGGSGVTVVNDLTTGGTTVALSAEMGKTLKGMIDVISSGAKVSASVSPSVIYKGVSSQITVSASVTKVTPSTLKIKDGDTVVASATNNQSVSQQLTVTVSSNSKTYDAEAVIQGMTLTTSVALSARYPIYYGFGANAAAVGVTANRYAATTSAAHTYSRTASANSQYFFILVPSDISGLTQFSMGGAPFAMDAETTTTISGVTYKVYKSSYAYNSGTALSVEAK